MGRRKKEGRGGAIFQFFFQNGHYKRGDLVTIIRRTIAVMPKKYIGVEDLLLDETFLSWHFRTDDRCIRQWEAWMAADPQNGARARQAVVFLRSLTLREKEIPAEAITQAERSLLEKINEAEQRAVRGREVWLSGEAYSHVAKTPLKSRFIVHLNHFDIIVTGTQFNAVNRGQKANVMLKEGSVFLRTDQGKEMKMAPGDYVEYRNAGLQKKSVRSDSVLAWKEHKLIFEGTPLKKLIEVIREDYGVDVKTRGTAVGEKKIYGILPNDNLEVLLYALGATGDFAVEWDRDTAIIKDKNP